MVSISRKLSLGFILSISFMCAAISTGIFLMDSVLANLKFSAKEQLGAAISTIEIRVNRSERNLALKKMILLGADEQNFQKHNENFNEYHKNMYISIKAAAELLTSKAIKDNLRNKFITFYQEIQEFDKATEIMKMYQTGGEETAIREMRENRDKAGNLMNEIVEDLKRQATLHSEKYQEKATKVTSMILIITSLALLFAIIIAILTIKSITESLQTIHHTAARMYGGELDIEINIPAKDEFGDLAKALDRMRISLISANRLLDRKEGK
jgi:methyl-accepting chemotaxis protein